MRVLSDEDRYKLLKLLAENMEISQREIAEALSMSLGKTNYCLNALVAKGLLKVRNFRNNPNKKKYIYLLTRKGIDEKTRMTLKFLQRKQKEHEILLEEINELRAEALMLNHSEDIN